MIATFHLHRAILPPILSIFSNHDREVIFFNPSMCPTLYQLLNLSLLPNGAMETQGVNMTNLELTL